MWLKKGLSVACLLIASIGSSGQSFIIDRDTVYGYSPDEVRLIADKLLDLEYCTIERTIMQDQIDHYRQTISRYESIDRSYATEINIRNTMIENYQRQVIDLEKRNRNMKLRMNLTAGVAVVLIALSLVYGH